MESKFIKPGIEVSNYTFLELIGAGGENYEVWKCKDHLLNRPVAVKVFCCPMEDRDKHNQTLTNLDQQIGHWVALDSHPNIVRLNSGLFDISESDKNAAEDHRRYLVRGFVMEYSEIGDLSKFIKNNSFNSYSRDQIRQFLLGIARGMKHAHDHNLLHRDLKPQNILLFDNNEVIIPKLSDFGLTIALGTVANLGGTPEYMAPEQFDGMNIKESDIYSLGILFFEILTGKLPFQTSWTSTLDRFHKYSKLHKEALRPVVFAESPNFGKTLSDLVEAMMNVGKEKRPTADMVITAIEDIATNSLVEKLDQIHPQREKLQPYVFKKDVYRWNHVIHQLFGEQLYYIWLKSFLSLGKSSSWIRDQLINLDIRGWSVYGIFGTDDLLLRIWCDNDCRKLLDDKVFASFKGMAGGRCKELKVDTVRYLFDPVPQKIVMDPGGLAETIRQNANERQPEQEYAALKNKNIILSKLDRKNSFIKVFTAIRATREQDAKFLEQVIINELGQWQDLKKIRMSVYTGKGDYQLLIKFMAKKYFEIKGVPFKIWELADQYSIRIRTETSLAADSQLIESDDGQLASLVLSR